MTYFRMGNPYYHRRNTVSRPCSGWEGVGPARYARQEFCWFGRGFGLRAHGRDGRSLGEVKLGVTVFGARWAIPGRRFQAVLKTAAQGYRIKPHGQLVLVSSRHYCPSTPSLSTS